MTIQRLTIAIALVLVGLSAGFFFTYEASVTLGLAEVDDVTYVKTFQAINATIRNFWFGLVFFGSLPALVLAFAVNTNAGTKVLLAGAFGLYVLCAGITMAGNVPLNEDLAEVTEVTPDSAADARADFEADWNQLNLLRTFAVVASFGILVFAATKNPTDGGNDQTAGDSPIQSAQHEVSV